MDPNEPNQDQNHPNNPNQTWNQQQQNHQNPNQQLNNNQQPNLYPQMNPNPQFRNNLPNLPVDINQYITPFRISIVKQYQTQLNDPNYFKQKIQSLACNHFSVDRISIEEVARRLYLNGIIFRNDGNQNNLRRMVVYFCSSYWGFQQRDARTGRICYHRSMAIESNTFCQLCHKNKNMRWVYFAHNTERHESYSFHLGGICVNLLVAIANNWTYKKASKIIKNSQNREERFKNIEEGFRKIRSGGVGVGELETKFLEFLEKAIRRNYQNEGQSLTILIDIEELKQLNRLLHANNVPQNIRRSFNFKLNLNNYFTCIRNQEENDQLRQLIHGNRNLQPEVFMGDEQEYVRESKQRFKIAVDEREKRELRGNPRNMTLDQFFPRRQTQQAEVLMDQNEDDDQIEATFQANNRPDDNDMGGQGGQRIPLLQAEIGSNLIFENYVRTREEMRMRIAEGNIVEESELEMEIRRDIQREEAEKAIKERQKQLKDKRVQKIKQQKKQGSVPKLKKSIQKEKSRQKSIEAHKKSLQKQKLQKNKSTESKDQKQGKKTELMRMEEIVEVQSQKKSSQQHEFMTDEFQNEMVGVQVNSRIASESPSKYHVTIKQTQNSKPTYTTPRSPQPQLQPQPRSQPQLQPQPQPQPQETSTAHNPEHLSEEEVRKNFRIYDQRNHISNDKQNPQTGVAHEEELKKAKKKEGDH